MLLEKTLQTSQNEYVHIWSSSFGDWTWSNLLLACMAAHVALSSLARQNLSLHFKTFSCSLWMPQKNIRIPHFQQVSNLFEFCFRLRKPACLPAHWPILASLWPNHRIPFGLARPHHLGAAKHLIGYFQTPWWYISFQNLTAATWMPMLCCKNSTHGLMDLESSLKKPSQPQVFHGCPGVTLFPIDLPQFLQAWSSKATNTKASPAAQRTNSVALWHVRAAVAALTMNSTAASLFTLATPDRPGFTLWWNSKQAWEKKRAVLFWVTSISRGNQHESE